MSLEETGFTPDNLNIYLKELAKEYRKLSKDKIHAEIILVGGAAVMANYGFRDVTFDIDAIFRASAAMKEAIQKVGNKYNLPYEWFNSDFKNTNSYTERLREYSKYYRTFSNIVEFRTISEEYLIAMKLMSARPYKHDLSDVAGIVAEHEKNGNPLTMEKILKAVEELYDTTDFLSEDAKKFLEQVFEYDNLEDLMEERKEFEEESKELALIAKEKYGNIFTEDNLTFILEIMRKKEEHSSETTIEPPRK